MVGFGLRRRRRRTPVSLTGPRTAARVSRRRVRARIRRRRARR